MVGPVPGESNVLRATDGERFVVSYKNNGFMGELLTAMIIRLMQYATLGDWDSSLCDHLSSRKRVVCVSKRSMCDLIQRQIRQRRRWTTSDRKRGCKNFFDHYNATPSLEATIAQKRSVEVRPDVFDCVCRLLALINFWMAPLTCCTIPNQVFSEPPSVKVKKLRQFQAMSLYK